MVGVVAVGVAKCKADHTHQPAETHQALVLNGPRGLVTVSCALVATSSLNLVAEEVRVSACVWRCFGHRLMRVA